MFKKLTFLTAIFFALINHAQTDYGAWYMTFNTISLSENWQVQNDIQYRSFNAGTDMEQLMLRGGLGLNLSEENNNLLLGYAFIRSGELGAENQEFESHFNEHRIYQQFITKQRFGRFYFSHRYRLEERFLTNNFLVRFRYFLNLRIAITKKKLVANTLYFSTYNEIFINGQDTLYDRNRLYGALGYQISDSFRIDVGTMAQIYEQDYRAQFQLGFFKAF